MNKAQVEALKEFARLVVIAAVSAGLVAAQAAVGLVTDPYAQLALGTFLGFVIKAWDKFVHKSDSPASGVVPF